MIHTDYAIDALDVLLCEDCLMERYAPLLAHKERLLTGLRRQGCRTKSDAAALSDAVFAQMGVDDPALLLLFRRFLTIYDPSPAKFREIEKVCADEKERAAFRELYHLPGVKAIRAALYCRAGYTRLEDFAGASEKDVLEKTARTIAQEHLSCAVPLPKEVRTHIAVARAFLWD